MARAKSREETEKEITAKACEEVGTKARDLMDMSHGKAPTAGSEDEGAASSRGGSSGSANDDASDDESSHTYCFDVLTITLGQIREMAEKCHFTVGEARVAGEEKTPELQ
jgi:hypothetical protein